MQPLLVTTNEAAHMLGVARSTIYQLIGRGAIPTVNIGRSLRLRVDDLETFVDRLVDDPT
jgi:excisionase family DNA binding protein